MSTTELLDTKGVRAPSPVLDQKYAAGLKHVAVVAFFGAFYLYLSYLPLFHTDIWGHVAYGKWMLEHRAIPVEDPFLPLSQGMRVVDSAWLSQLVLGWVTLKWGAEGLSALFAVTVFLTYLIFTRAYYLVSGRISLAIFGSSVTLYLCFGRHSIIRPEMVGSLCFSILVWLIVRAEPWRSRTVAFANRPTENREKQFWPLWIGIPLLFLVWANAHGSFLIGVFVLGCHVLGRMIEVVGQTRGLKAIFRDRWLVRWILLTEAAIAMSLVNPYGIDLVIETALFNSNSNMKDIVEWYPLKLVDAEGLQFCLAVTLWIALYRHSRQRVSPIDVLLLLVFSAGVAKAIRIIGWFAAVFSLCMMPHVADVGARLLDKLQQRVPAWLGQRKFAYSLVCLLFVWIAFAGSPLGGLALGGKPRPASRVYTSQTPRGIAKFLRRQPPQGLVYAPQWWADWIAWDGPAGIKTVVSTNVHLAPRLVWDGYMQVSQGREFWDDLLDRWNVDTVIADKKDQERLTRELRGSDVWQLVYEDDFGIIAKRRSRLNAAKP